MHNFKVKGVDAGWFWLSAPAISGANTEFNKYFGNLLVLSQGQGSKKLVYEWSRVK
ncbi:MAG: hypothetical protein IPM91_13105 [Bacteroidetes bacterium]|nr:hypothetical protein [Bacteroidota bacterium]